MYIASFALKALSKVFSLVKSSILVPLECEPGKEVTWQTGLYIGISKRSW